MANIIEREGEDVKDIFNRIRKRDFRGYTGLATKNSLYVFLTNIVGKIGSFVFVIILARLLMPDLFGLYSLALVTILLFAGFSELGIAQTFVKFISKELGERKNKKAKAYAYYLLKIKLILMSLVVVLLAASAKFISQNYYNKPIFFALIAGILYIIFVGLTSIFYYFFQSTNDFKIVFYKEIFFQLVRIIFVPLLILYSLKYISSVEIIVLILILGLSFVWFLTFLFLVPFVRKKMYFLKAKTEKLSQREKKKIQKFLLQLLVLGFSGLFFAQIDMVFLGRFVLSNFIGYYAVAISLIVSLGTLIAFSVVFLPIFTRLKGVRLEKGFKKTIRMTFILSLLLFILTITFASFFIKIFYGQAYLISIPLLRLLSPLIISMPLISIYTVYFIAIGKPKIVTRWLLYSTIINIVLNYFLIIWLINYSQIAAVFGVSVATLASRYFYLVVLVKSRK